ncbi:MBL fold hydrolase [Halorientalis sp. IM1011]|uniref:MBL fold metallo-hydrolase n=1 Tax=Halorientalis sp. IM1011 TaxID=1932360 RepID=UPI00097CD2CB|nr:MBL fold metallo-hydrolase [Halorientalis sp. IM1011]AQL43774.1 MBL fold hydrolase [Halorientalis sp. IM1011]
MFTQLTVPTPFQIGAVDAYLAGRTLIDPGPNSEEAWSRLLDALEERGLSHADIERVVVTHPHPDHFGLASRFRDAGASVVATPDAAGIMADFEGRFERERAFFTDFFERCGMARSTAETVTSLPEAFLRYAPDVETDQKIVSGDTLVVHDTVLDVDEVLGHADGECILSFDSEGERRAIVGDHVLPEITPNPFLLPPDEDGERPRVLPAYNRSLDRLRDREYDRLLPGHREVIETPSERIGEIREAHEDRTDDVRELVDGPTTPVDVMDGLFGDLPATEGFAGMSEAVGHLDVLEDRGEVTRRDRGGVLVYEPV